LRGALPAVEGSVGDHTATSVCTTTRFKERDRHHQFAQPPASKNFSYKKPPNACHQQPKTRHDRQYAADVTT